MRAIATICLLSSAIAGVSPVIADEVSDIFRGTAGAVVGGAVGNHVGQGSGRAVATAAGAVAGSLIASNCRAGTGTFIGGLIGGLLGYQIGQGNGQNVAAAAGAAIGARLSSDCSPVEAAAVPVALALPAVRFNGRSFQPLSGFPLEAFRGVPPIASTHDLEAAREVAVRLAAGARESMLAGDTETAMLKMYWAKKIGLAALAITSASIDSINSLSAANGKVRARVAAKSLVILPAHESSSVPPDTELVRRDKVAAWLDRAGHFAHVDWAQHSAQVADNGPSAWDALRAVSSVLNSLSGVAGSNQGAVRQAGEVLGGLAGQRPNVLPAPGAHPRGALDADAAGLLAGPQEGQPYQLANGLIVLKQKGQLTVYNPRGEEADVELDALNFVPRTPVLSAVRKEAASLVKTINDNGTEWVFSTYWSQINKQWFFISYVSPNLLIDKSRNRKVVGYFDSEGRVTSNPNSGAVAFKKDVVFKTAMSVHDGMANSTGFQKFISDCANQKLGHFTKIHGDEADLSTATCFTGEYPAVTQVLTRTFWLGEAGRAVQTLESMIADTQFLDAMKGALVAGKTTSDVLAALGTPVGNVESALQCFGKDSMAQLAAVEAVRAKTAGSANRWAAAGSGYTKAKVLGWTPEPAEWGVDRVANCIGTVPLVGGAVAGGVKATGKLSGAVLASLPSLDRMESAFKLFNSPSSFGKYAEGLQLAESLFPANPVAARFVKSAYDFAMSGVNLKQLGGDFSEIGALVSAK